MPTEEFWIRYKVAAAEARREIAALRKELVDFDRQVDKSEAKLAALGKNHAGIAAFRTALTGLGAALKSTETISQSSASALSGVGKNTADITRAATKVGKLDAAIQSMTANAQAGSTALGGLGGNMPGGGAGKIGGFGGSTFGGTVRRAVTGHAVSQLFRAGRRLFDAGGEAAEDSRQFADRTGAAAQDFRASLREVATLEGKRTVDDAMVRDQLKLIEGTGSSPGEALEFRSVYKGAVGASLLAHQTTGGRLGMTEKTATELMPEAMKFAARTEMDAETAAKMFGLMGVYQSVPNKEAAMKTAGAVQGHLNILGVGTMKQLGRPFFGLMGEMAGEGGRVSDPERLAATFAAETVRAKSPAIAATEIRQANRATMKLAESGAFGITKEDDYTAQIRKVATGLKGMDGAKQIDTLKAYGLGNELEISSAIKQAKLVDIVDAQMKSPEVKKFSDDAMKLNQEYMSSDVGRTYSAEAKVFSAEIQRGMETERVKALRDKAKADRMLSSGPLRTGTVKGAFGESLMDWWNVGSGEAGADRIADKFAVEDLIARGSKVGYDVKAKHPGMIKDITDSRPFMLSGRPWDAEERRRGEMTSADAAISKLEAAAEALNNAAQAQQAANPAGRPPGNAGAVPVRN